MGAATHRIRWWLACHCALATWAAPLNRGACDASEAAMSEHGCDSCTSQSTSLLQIHSNEKLDPATCTEAVLVEMRALNYTALPLQSALRVPGIDLITLAHGKNNSDFSKRLVEKSNDLQEAYRRGFLRLMQLPFADLGSDGGNGSKRPNVSLAQGISLVQTNRHGRGRHHLSYTGLFLDPEFWKLFQCDRIFIFQSDTIFCRNTAVSLKEFTDYPYIGPHTPSMDGGPERIHMNGGFSIRNRSDMIRCIEKDNINEVLYSVYGEDEIFSRCRSLRQPPVNVTDRFAIDNGFKVTREPPLGVHKPWFTNNATKICQLCEGAQALWDAALLEAPVNVSEDMK